MKKETFDRIWEIQEQLRDDREHQAFLAEYEVLNNRFLQQLASMTQTQRDAVMDYCGVLIELQLRTWKYMLEHNK